MHNITLKRIRDHAGESVPPVACSQRTITWRENGGAQSRGTILVASTDSTFLDTVGGMVVASGFTPAYPVDREAPWLSVTRTQPCIAICDCGAPVERIQRLVFEAWTRRVPVLVSTSEQSIGAQRLTPPHVGRLRLPLSLEAFCSMVDALLPSVPQAVRRMPAIAAGTGLASVKVRTLSVVPRNRWKQGRLERD